VAHRFVERAVGTAYDPGTLATELVLVSADSHVSDFPHFWGTGLKQAYGARAPHLSRDGGVSAHGISTSGLFGDWVVAEGIPPIPAGPGNVGGFPKEERGRRIEGFDVTRDPPPGAVDPRARIEAMRQDGLACEYIIPTYGLRLNTLGDADLQRACVTAANDWLAEFCRAVPDRLFGGMALSIHDPVAGVAELHRGLGLGLKGAMVPAVPPPAMTYASLRYEPFWAAAAEAGVPVTLHALPPPETAAASQRPRPTVTDSRVENLIEHHHLAHILYDHAIQVSLSQLILSGVLKRHPKLKIVISEWGTAWIPNFLARLDGSYLGRPEGLSLRMLPSEYYRRQVWCTFDRSLDLPRETVELLQDRLMYASDYPHIESSWPESRSTFDRECGALPAAIQRKLASENFASLYGVAIPNTK
jgi:uncharacterized protein